MNLRNNRYEIGCEQSETSIENNYIQSINALKRNGKTNKRKIVKGRPEMSAIIRKRKLKLDLMRN
jgi:hypothetical protein